jgi:predicted RNase H-like HicB family nuclease
MNKFILSEYISAALAKAEYEKLEDNTYAGRIPPCKGVIAFGNNLESCREELRSGLEEWILLGLKLKHQLPIIANINLNLDPKLEQLETN